MSADFSCQCLNIKIRVVAAATKEFQGTETPMQNQHPTVLVQLRDQNSSSFSQVKATGPVSFAKIDFRAEDEYTESQLSRDPFFAGQNCKVLKPVGDFAVEVVVSVRFPALLRCRWIQLMESGVGDWLVGRCLVCDRDAWAYPKCAEVKKERLFENSMEKSDVFYRFSQGTQVLISGNLLEKGKIRAMLDSTDFSAAVGLAWARSKKASGHALGLISDLQSSDEMGKLKELGRKSSSSSSSVDREDSLEGGRQIMGEGFTGLVAQSEAAQQIQAACSDYLRREQEAMDTRIRAFIDKETREFEGKRQKAKADRDSMLRELENKTLVLTDISSGLTRSERQKSGGEESANDSAVPLSPVSLASLNEPSPLPATGIPPTPASPSQPKSQLFMGQWSQSEDCTMIPAGDEDLFSFDEDNPTALSGEGYGGVPQTPGYLPADDEAETDDSGTAEDYGGYHRYYNNSGANSKQQQKQNHSTNYNWKSGGNGDAGAGGKSGGTPITGIQTQRRTEGVGQLAFGTSMPVKIPGKYWPPKDANDSIRQSEASSSDEENDQFLLHRTVIHKRRNTGSGGVGTRPHDVAAGMRALARSIQAADDPERLFGEYPQRRRYKTGDVAVSRMRSKAGSGGHNNDPAASVGGQVFPKIVKAQQ